MSYTATSSVPSHHMLVDLLEFPEWATRYEIDGQIKHMIRRDGSIIMLQSQQMDLSYNQNRCYYIIKTMDEIVVQSYIIYIQITNINIYSNSYK